MIKFLSGQQQQPPIGHQGLIGLPENKVPRATITVMQLRFQNNSEHFITTTTGNITSLWFHPQKRHWIHSVPGNSFSEASGRMVASWYQQERRPIFKEICTCLHMKTDEEEDAERVFDLLVGFLREQRENENLLRRFLRFSTSTPNA